MRKNKRRIDTVEVRATEQNLTGFGGVHAIMAFCRRTGVWAMIDSRLPTPGSNGYPASHMVRTLWAAQILMPGISVLEGVERLRGVPGMAAMLEMEEVPAETSVGDWLRRLGGVELRGKGCARGGWPEGLDAVRGLFYEIMLEIAHALPETLGDCLDFDATIVHENKKYDVITYEGDPGVMAYQGYLGWLCVCAEIEPGNHSPNDHIAARISSVLDMLKKADIPVTRMRSDGAGYVAELFNSVTERSVLFYIRAAQDDAVVPLLRRETWRTSSVACAHERQREVLVADTVHVMGKTNHAFRLVAEKRQWEVKPKEDDPPELLTVPRIETMYLPVATNDCSMSAETVLSFFGARMGACEQAHRNVKSDAGMGLMPCRGADGFPANRAYAYLANMLHNIFGFYQRATLNEKQHAHRLTTIATMLFMVPAVVALVAHRLVIALPAYMKEAAQMLATHIARARTFARVFHVAETRFALGTMVYRRE